MKTVRALLLITSVFLITAPAFAVCRFCKPSGNCSSIGNPTNISCVVIGPGVCEDMPDETCAEGLRDLNDDWSLASVEVRQDAKVQAVKAQPAKSAVTRTVKTALPRI